MGSAHGHTGHVRFLTSIELPEGFDVNFPLPADITGNQVTPRTNSASKQICYTMFKGVLPYS